MNISLFHSFQDIRILIDWKMEIEIGIILISKRSLKISDNNIFSISSDNTQELINSYTLASSHWNMLQIFFAKRVTFQVLSVCIPIYIKLLRNKMKKKIILKGTGIFKLASYKFFLFSYKHIKNINMQVTKCYSSQ